MKDKIMKFFTNKNVLPWLIGGALACLIMMFV